MKHILHKLRSHSGETLTETLVAMLVISCGSVLLATMLSSSIKLSSDARVRDEALYYELSAVEQTSDGGSFNTGDQNLGKLVITETGSAARSWEISILMFGNETDKTLFSYERKGASS